MAPTTTSILYGVKSDKEYEIKHTTISILYGIKSNLESIRRKMDAYMYGSEKALPDEDHAYCRKVYDSICKTLDLL